MTVPIVVVYDLAVPRSKKYVIMSAFAFRILFDPLQTPHKEHNLTSRQSHHRNDLPSYLPHTGHARRRLHKESFRIPTSHSDRDQFERLRRMRAPFTTIHEESGSGLLFGCYP